MPTPTQFDEVIDLGLTSIDDYKLTKLYNQSYTKFLKVCDSYLIAAIPNFSRCKQSLDYDITNRQFVNQLTNDEISILADFWVMEWFKKETLDSRKINNLLQSSGSFKTHSNSENLKVKNTSFDGLREKVAQKITDYQLKDIQSIDI